MALSSSSSTVDDSVSPFFLQSGDSPSTILVTHPHKRQLLHMATLDTTSVGCQKQVWIHEWYNFITNWRIRFFLLCLVSSNSMIILWIINYVSKEITQNIIGLNTAREIWQELQDSFTQSNGPRIFQLEKDLLSLTQGNSLISNYYIRFDGL